MNTGQKRDSNGQWMASTLREEVTIYSENPMDTNWNDDSDSFTPHSGGDILTKKENAETDILTKFNKWINNKIDDPVNSIYMAGAGAIGLMMYTRFKAGDRLIQQIEAEYSEDLENKEGMRDRIKQFLDGDVFAFALWRKPPAEYKFAKLPTKTGPFAFMIVNSAELSEMSRIQRETYYGAFAFAIAGWSYWLMKNPQVMQSAMEMIGVMATATADWIEDAVDWMPF